MSQKRNPELYPFAGNNNNIMNIVGGDGVCVSTDYVNDNTCLEIDWRDMANNLKVPDGGPQVLTLGPNGNLVPKELSTILEETQQTDPIHDIKFKGEFAEYYIRYKGLDVQNISMEVRYEVQKPTLLILPNEIKQPSENKTYKTYDIGEILSICQTLMTTEKFLNLQKEIFEKT